MTSANQEPESTASNESERNENLQQSEGEVALDPNPSKALTELATGSAPEDESSSKDA